jgi:hypothetical protein
MAKLQFERLEKYQAGAADADEDGSSAEGIYVSHSIVYASEDQVPR